MPLWNVWAALDIRKRAKLAAIPTVVHIAPEGHSSVEPIPVTTLFQLSLRVRASVHK